MLAQASGVLLAGQPPPPLSTEPMKYAVTSRRLDAVLLHLGHLADLLRQGHAREQVFHALLGRGGGVEVEADGGG